MSILFKKERKKEKKRKKGLNLLFSLFLAEFILINLFNIKVTAGLKKFQLCLMFYKLFRT